MKTPRLFLLLLCATVFQWTAEAGQVDPTKIAWPEAARNFHTLEYFFDPITHKFTVRLWGGQQRNRVFGNKDRTFAGKAKRLLFHCALEDWGENESMFERTLDNSSMVSFNAPGFDPKKDQLIYRGENSSDTRSIPYKGGAKASERARTAEPK